MILYYTGTGNSRYIAERLAAATEDRIVCLNDRIRSGDTSPVICDKEVIFVTPTYAWRIPRIVEKYILDTAFNGAETVRFVMDCGSEIGNASKYNFKLSEKKQWKYLGTAQVIMPENYIAMFSVPGREEADHIIDSAEPVIDRAAECIREGKTFDQPKCTLAYRIMSGPVNTLFYGLFVKAKAFAAGDACVQCGKCVKICPLNNIELHNGKPIWGNHCTHCMACISYCPREAIEYGRKSIGQPRYRCERKADAELKPERT